MLTPRLTSIESAVLQDADFFITKASIDAKINDLFSVLKTQIEEVNAGAADLPAPILASPGRMYRGEHLGPLPWRALDCPRVFSGKDILAFRTLLVWGHEFSFHFLLSGQWFQKYGPHLPFISLREAGWRLSRQDSPWDWSLNAESHALLSNISLEEWTTMLSSHSWLKLSIAHPLTEFDTVPEVGLHLWKGLLTTFQ